MKKYFLGILVIILATALISCSKDNGRVTALSFNHTTAAVLKGTSVDTIKVTVNPADVAVSYSSEDPAIATVNTEGLITGVKYGSTVIVASAGSLTARCHITVCEEPYEDIDVCAVIIDDKSYSYCCGELDGILKDLTNVKSLVWTVKCQVNGADLAALYKYTYQSLEFLDMNLVTFRTDKTKYYNSSRDLTKDPTLSIPAGKVFPEAALYGFTKLKKAILPSYCATVCYRSMGECSSLEECVMSNNVTYIEKYAFASSALPGTLELPRNCEAVGVDAFLRCKATTVKLPKAYHTATAAPFSKMENLKEFVIDEGNSHLRGVNGCLCYVSEDTKKLIMVPIGIGKEGSSFTLPSGMTLIGEYAMDYCKFGQIKIPEGYTYFGSYCFGDNSSLKSLVFPASTEEIHLYSCCYDSALESVTILNDTKVVKLDGGNQTYEKPFEECTNLTSIYVPAKLLDAYKAHSVWGRRSTILKAIQ